MKPSGGLLPPEGERNYMDINQWMINHKYAKNEWNSQHIFNGLKLYEVKRFWERARRVIVYRLWRDAGEPSSVAYQNTLDGRKPLQML